MAQDVRVLDCGDNWHKLSIGPGWNIADMKSAIDDLLRIQPKDQHMYLTGDTEELHDEQELDRVSLYELVRDRGLPEGDVSFTKRSHVQAKWYAKVQLNPLSFNVHAPDEVRKDRDLLMLALTTNGMALEFVEEPMREDRDLALTAVLNTGKALQFVKEVYRDEEEFVMEAVKNYGLAMQFCASRLRKDKNLALVALENDGWALHWIAEELKGDRDCVLAAVRNVGRALMYAAEEFKDDDEIVTAAVERDGNALEFAAERFKGNGNIVLKAVRQNGDALKYAHTELRMHRTMLHVATDGRYATRSNDPMIFSPVRTTQTMVTWTWEELTEWHKTEGNFDFLKPKHPDKLDFDLILPPS